MQEKWKPVKNYEGFYEVSDCGNIRSLKRATTSGKILKPAKDNYGYLRVTLSMNGVSKTHQIHRVVAEAFVSGYSESKNQVNHKNEIKDDNRASNLEWCTAKYNTNYKNLPMRRKHHNSKPVVAIKGNKVMTFASQAEAGRALMVSPHNIGECVREKYGRKTLRGYKFEQVEERQSLKG